MMNDDEGPLSEEEIADIDTEAKETMRRIKKAIEASDQPTRDAEKATAENVLSLARMLVSIPASERHRWLVQQPEIVQAHGVSLDKLTDDDLTDADLSLTIAQAEFALSVIQDANNRGAPTVKGTRH
jgi:hypothetical protein